VQKIEQKKNKKIQLIFKIRIENSFSFKSELNTEPKSFLVPKRHRYQFLVSIYITASNFMSKSLHQYCSHCFAFLGLNPVDCNNDRLA